MTGLVLGGLVSNSSVNSSTCVSVNSEIGGKRVHMTITDIKVVVEWWKREKEQRDSGDGGRPFSSKKSSLKFAPMLIIKCLKKATVLMYTMLENTHALKVT